MAESEESLRSQKKEDILWITIPTAVVIIFILAAVGYYYYFFHYLKANLSDTNFNKITQSIDSEVKPGDQISYTIYYKNSGNLKVTGFMIKTQIPDNTSIISSSKGSKIGPDKKALEFNVGDLGADLGGSFVFTVKVNNPLDNGTSIKSKEVLFEYFAREKKENYSIKEVLEGKVISSPDFTNFSAKFVDLNGNKISMGDELAFSMSLENTGNMNAKNIRIISKLPQKFELVKNSIIPEAEFDGSSNQIIWKIDSLEASSIKNFTFRAKVGDNFSHLEEFKYQAQLEYAGKIDKEIELTDKVWGFPNFSTSSNTVTDIGSGDVWTGDILEYTILVKNTGLRTGENVSLYCPIPKGTTYVSKSAVPEVAAWSDEINGIEWNMDQINVGEEKTFKFKVKIGSAFIKGGSLENQFYIKGDEQEVQIEPVKISVRSFIFQTIVCMGDSQIPVSNWPASLDYLLESSYPHAEFNTIGSGVPQQMAYQGARRFDSSVAVYHPSIIVIGYGTNDVGSGTSLFASGIQDLINKAKSIGATVIVHSIGYIDTDKHSIKKGYQSYNSVLQDICANNGVPYVDIYGPMSGDPGKYVSADGLHWTPEGGALVANLVFNTIRNYLNSEGSRK
jgi:uncharacterized repeat protein (TIGR01451 family)